MLQAGDELGRTQRGNNNAYCQDNEITWLDWDLDDDRRELLEFTRRLIRLRADEPVFRRRTFFQGRPITAATSRTSTGSTPPAREMQMRRLGHAAGVPRRAARR